MYRFISVVSFSLFVVHGKMRLMHITGFLCSEGNLPTA